MGIIDEYTVHWSFNSFQNETGMKSWPNRCEISVFKIVVIFLLSQSFLAPSLSPRPLDWDRVRKRKLPSEAYIELYFVISSLLSEVAWVSLFPALARVRFAFSRQEVKLARMDRAPSQFIALLKRP